jgi:formylglycine-generating enzyme required for sulfatase activity
MAFGLLLLALLPGPPQEPPRRETVTIPGSTVKFDMVYLEGGRVRASSPGEEGALRDVELHPFWIGTREVSWAEFNLFFETKDLEGVDGITHPTTAKSYLHFAVEIPVSYDPPQYVARDRFGARATALQFADPR